MHHGREVMSTNWEVLGVHVVVLTLALACIVLFGLRFDGFHVACMQLYLVGSAAFLSTLGFVKFKFGGRWVVRIRFAQGRKYEFACALRS